MTTAIIIIAKYFIVFAGLGLVGCYFLLPSARRNRFAALAVIALPATYLVARLSQLFIYDARPFVVGHFTPLIAHAADNGFPSDHTLLASAIASVVTVYHRPLGAALWLVAILIGTARVLAGVHHTLDIVGAMLIAAAVALLTEYLLRRVRWYSAAPERFS